MGRPRDRAPEGFVTVREAAQVLGVSEQAVRARLDRGTLPEREELLQSGEVRHYIPRAALQTSEYDKLSAASREQADELHLAMAFLVKELLEGITAELRRHDASMNRALREEGEKFREGLDALTACLTRDLDERQDLLELMREMAECDKTYQDHVAMMVEEQAERRKQMREERRERRILSVLVLAGIVALILIGLLEITVHLPTL